MVWQTVAGLAVGKSKNQIVRVNTVTGDTRCITIKGRYLYVKKCKRESQINGIEIPEKTQTDTTFCIVLAVGERCGKWHQLSDVEEKINATLDNSLFNIIECCPDDIRVYDKIFAPDNDPYFSQKGISRTAYANDEYLLHECLAIGAVEE